MNNKWIYSSLGIILLGLMLLLPSISALTTSTFTKEEVKSLDRITSFGTYKIEASAWYDPLQIWTKETIKEIELKTNTEKCIDCLSEGTIVLNKDGTLIDDLIWRRSFDEGKTFVDWKGFTNWRVLVEEDVDVFETQCINRKEIFDEKNGTSYFEQECSQVKTGTTKKWNNLDYKKEYKAGTYNYKIEGSKKAEVIYDWVIKTNGQLLENWAVWGNISTGSQAEVVLNSPANNSIQYTTLVTTNASANVTNGAYLVNAKLYDNSTGTWGARNTSLYDGTFQISEVSYSQSALTPITVYSGVKVIPSKDIWVWEVNKTSLTTATRALILDSSLNVLTSTTTLSGNKFIFSSAFKLNASSTYYVVLDANGASYVSTWTQAIGLPITSNKIQYTKGLQGTTDYNNRLFSINYINYTNSNLPPSQALTVKFTNSYPAGSNIKWNYQFCDSDGDCGFAPQNFTFSIDSIAPTITLNYPTALIDYGKLNQTLQLNFTATDTNLDKVWYNYNGTNVTITGATSGVANLSNITLSSKKNVTIYANDTAGNLNTTTFSWDYVLFANQTIYNPTTTTTSGETFTLVTQKDSTVASISATLHYNGGSYLSTVTSSGNNVNISNTFEIPAGANTRNFFWEITAVGTGGTYYINTTSLTQNVSNLSLAYCTSPSTTGLTLNFTTYDGTTLLPLNSSFEASFSYYAYGGSGTVLETYNYQNLSENRSNFMFCLNSSGKNVTLDGFLNYYKTGYDPRNYILDNAIIGNFTQNIPLYLTATSLTDIVTFTVQDQNYDPLAGALVTVQEWNVGTNTYSTIGMFTTSSEGQGIMDLELYNTWYRAIVTYNGVIVKVTDVQKLGSTTWAIKVELGVDNPYDLFGTITHGLVFDNITNITTFSWVDTSGYVNQGCLTVKNSTNLGYVTLSEQCVTSVSGTINYQLTPNSTYAVYGTIDLTATYDNVSQITDVLNIDLNGPTLLGKTISPFGKVISFILLGTAGGIGIAAGSPILTGGLILLVLFGAWKIGWLLLTESIFWGIVITLILILIKQSRRGG